MIRVLAACSLVSLIALATAANAEDVNVIQGFYANNAQTGAIELEADVTHVEGDRYSVSLSTTVAIQKDLPGCGGGIDGEVTLSEGTGVMSVENEGYIPNDTSPGNKPYCEIQLSFDEEKMTLDIEELSGCGYYHGASCSFTGALTHDAAGV